jgi:rhamnose transport system substrate-binding protein/rhamnose transport system permease protein
MTRPLEAILVAAVLVEIAVFGAFAPRFLSIANAFEIVRASVELGLLAVALTPILVSGGIDLSVGAMLGLSAIVFGAAVNDWGVGVPAAIALALLTGGAGGALNAALVARLDVPPLIVTLGSMSLFRGIAEGITHGAVNYTGFPSRFVAFGQGYLGGTLPAQVPLFIAIAVAYAVLLHRSIAGRALYAIGFARAGARYAGIPVRRRIAAAYVLAGVVSSVAAVVYVAHLGQARSDAGNGYELDAITAAVLGGTSVFGGRGTIGGTLLGLGAISIMRNGLELVGLPSELAGVLTGALLIATIALDRVRMSAGAESAREAEGFSVRNSQVAAICAAVIAAAIIVASTNAWLVHSLGGAAGADSTTAAPRTAQDKADAAHTRPVIAMMPKAKGDPYFISCRAGAEEAAKELNVDLIWDGPTNLDAARQNELVENWITRRVDAIAVAVENRGGISSVLRKARAKGIKVLTWDADAEPDARDFFVNQATPEGIANTLTDEAARLLGGEGQFAIITGALSAANQNEWIANIRKRLAEKYPKLTLATIRPSDDDRDKAFAETQTVLRVYPAVKLVMAISAPAVPGSAEAVRQANRAGDVRVIGLSLPNINKPYVHGGVVQAVVLWNTRDLGYLTVLSAAQLVRQAFAPGATAIEAGRLGQIEVRGSEIVLGAPLLMNKGNIDRYDF